ncbi:MAG: Jag N-terminal domain-containing protein [Candidatus Omnitrophica bacterium]|nr:Jag N-terminal domain-containing protein [Candidatus Omnitrophota bacterium]
MSTNEQDNKEKKSFEFVGSTIEEAIKKALEELQVKRDDIIVKVVSEEKKGLFGMEGANPAKIKVIMK